MRPKTDEETVPQKKAIEHLKAERTRTRIGHIKLFERFLAHDSNRPSDLRVQDLCRWMVGGDDAIPKAHFEYVSQAYKALPTRGRFKPVSVLVAFTPEMARTLKDERGRTQLSPYAMKGRAIKMGLDVPAHRFTDKVYRWLRGEVQFVEKAAYEEVMALYRAMPSASYRYFAITQEQRGQLEDEMQRTGLGAEGLLKFARRMGIERPAALSAYMINAWRSGETAKVRDDHYDWVMGVLEQVPNDAGKSNRRRTDRPNDREDIEFIKRVVLSD